MNFASLLRAFDAIAALRGALNPKRGPGTEGAADAPTALTQTPSAGSGLANQIEARLTNVVVAALKEAFDRDHARLELERAQLDEQRRRAEDAMRLELRRQAAEREIGRLRLLAGTALLAWLASVLVLGLRAAGMSAPARVALGIGWLLQLGALAAAFTAQGRVADSAREGASPDDSRSGRDAAVWLLIAGLALTAISVLI